MEGKNTALKAGLGYTIGNVLVKGINFLTIPLFSRLLTPAEFGVYNVFLSYDSILTVLVGFAMATSVKSAHYEFKKTVNHSYIQKLYAKTIGDIVQVAASSKNKTSERSF